MKKGYFIGLLPFYLLVLILFVGIAQGGSSVATVIQKNQPIRRDHSIIIDPGHGGIDGGATSCTGVLESKLNLEIALRLDDLLHFLGYETVMIRTTDISIYTQGDTIAAQKVSDLKERVRICNETDNAVLISIHQNTFSDSRYSGAQVFYAPTEQSRELASDLQNALVTTLNPDSNRKSKKSSGIYLMEHIECTGILIECGFLSNPAEEARIRSEEYQKKLCCVFSSVLSNYMES